MSNSKARNSFRDEIRKKTEPWAKGAYQNAAETKSVEIPGQCQFTYSRFAWAYSWTEVAV